MYCAEAADFQFLFYSFLQKRSVGTTAILGESVVHGAIRMESGAIHDYFGVSKYYPSPKRGWEIYNPLQSISSYYHGEYTESLKNRRPDIGAAEISAQYDKYSVSAQSCLMEAYYKSQNPPYEKIIAHGEFVLKEAGIDQVMSGDDSASKNNLEIILQILLVGYEETKDWLKLRETLNLLERYFGGDPTAKEWLQYYQQYR
jgi:hypothetical protein